MESGRFAQILLRGVDLPSSARVRRPESSEKHRATTAPMMNSQTAVESLSASDLLSATRELVQTSRGVEAELLVHLGEIDERRLYLDWAFPSMFAFCVVELGFSEDAAYNRIGVARAARRLPVIVEAIRSGQVHLAGLRVLAPHLTADNNCEVLAQAAGKSKREIEELVARLWPQPPVPAVVRKLPDRPNSPPEASSAFSFGTAMPVASPESSPALAFASPAPRRDERRAVIAPLTEETFKFQFTGSRACRDKLREAQDLLRHRIPDGDPATIFEKALDLLIEHVKKERFATGRKARPAPTEATTNRVRVTYPTRSSARSSSVTVAAARSRTSAAGGAPRRAAWNSITATGLRERISTERTGSACCRVDPGCAVQGRAHQRPPPQTVRADFPHTASLEVHVARLESAVRSDGWEYQGSSPCFRWRTPPSTRDHAGCFSVSLRFHHRAMRPKT